MVSRNKPLARLVGLGLLSSVALMLSACGGQIPIAGSYTVAGDPPPLPPPPPPKVEEPPKPPPRVEVRDNKIEIKEKIQFDTAKATIKPESFSLLDEIVQVFKDNPHILKVAIEGHASKEGGAAFNRKLSDDRAKAVRQYLVDHGIEADRLTAKGYGFDKPIATNDTEEGREANRRVEFNIVKQDVTKKKVEIDPATGKERVVEATTTTDEKADEATVPAAAAPAGTPAKPATAKPAPAPATPPTSKPTAPTTTPTKPK